MRIDPLRLLLFATRLQAAIANRSGTLPRGDAGLYVACRELVEQLERTNPLIWIETGYSTPVADVSLDQ
ncbi:MAG: hypothetical protein HC890_07810 [Chloroflexaceae bacterium]|nr:hypothetical protein [Chloroflexaceae bacterium]